jgi:hypothetical protein
MLRKIPYDTCAPILERFDLTDDAVDIVAPDLAPEAAIDVMAKNALMTDMVQFFAQGMPPREGVCWALAVQKDLMPEVSVVTQELWGRVVKWVRDPQERTRIGLMQAGENGDNDDPITWLCNAVAWNGSGSIGPIDGPTVLPPERLHAAALVGAVALLAGETDDSLAAALKAIQTRGLEVAQGGWPVVSG